MKRVNKKNLISLFFAAIMIFAVCLPVSAGVERQSIHINTPGISLEIPGDAIYNIREADTGELMNGSDEGNTYLLTLTAEKSDDELFTYKDLSKKELEQEQSDIQSRQNADKVTTYETSQAVFFDCINNNEKYLLSTTVVNGYKYQLKLSVEKRELTISDHGIFNTAARSVVFDTIEKKPAEVNVLGTIGTVVCIAIAVLVLAVLVVFVVRYLVKTKLPNLRNQKGRFELSKKERAAKVEKAERIKQAVFANQEARVQTDKEESGNSYSYHGQIEEQVGSTERKVQDSHRTRSIKIQPLKSRKRDLRSDSAAESYYKEIEHDGLFDEQEEDEIPTQVKMDIIDNVPGDEKFENNPIRMMVDIIKPVPKDGEADENSGLYELSRNNNEDYDEASEDCDDYSEEKSFGDRIKGIFKKQSENDNKAENKIRVAFDKKKDADENRRNERLKRTEEKRMRQAAERRREREESRSQSDSEFVKSFESDSYWDKYR